MQKYMVSITYDGLQRSLIKFTGPLPQITHPALGSIFTFQQHIHIWILYKTLHTCLIHTLSSSAYLYAHPYRSTYELLRRISPLRSLQCIKCEIMHYFVLLPVFLWLDYFTFLTCRYASHLSFRLRSLHLLELHSVGLMLSLQRKYCLQNQRKQLITEAQQLRVARYQRNRSR